MSDNALLNYGLSAAAPDQRRKIANALMARQWDRPTPEEGNVVERGSIIPFGAYDNGRTGFAWPSIVHQPVNSFARVLSGEIQPGTPEFNEAGFDISGAAMVGGLMGARPRNALGMGGRPTEPPKGITAYHGSPHDFDRFDMSKIGTGEGAQAFGHGLYFADNEAVARTYRDSTSTLSAHDTMKRATDAIDSRVPEYRADSKRYVSPYNLVLQYADLPNPASEMKRAAAIADPIERRALLAAAEVFEQKPPGRLYEVNIKANPDDFLDWDKPLRQQSESVQRALGQQVIDVVGPNNPGSLLPDFMRQASGASDASVSEALKGKGIPGIRYLDQGSRTAGDGSRNYVVFDDNLIEILRKYGLMGMIGAGGFAAELMKPSKIPEDAA